MKYMNKKGEEYQNYWQNEILCLHTLMRNIEVNSCNIKCIQINSVNEIIIIIFLEYITVVIFSN